MNESTMNGGSRQEVPAEEGEIYLGNTRYAIPFIVLFVDERRMLIMEPGAEFHWASWTTVDMVHWKKA